MASVFMALGIATFISFIFIMIICISTIVNDKNEDKRKKGNKR